MDENREGMKDYREWAGECKIVVV